MASEVGPSTRVASHASWRDFQRACDCSPDITGSTANGVVRIEKWTALKFSSVTSGGASESLTAV